jgi:hypothetical protein
MFAWMTYKGQHAAPGTYMAVCSGGYVALHKCRHHLATCSWSPLMIARTK